MLAFPDSNYDGFKVKSQSTLRLGTYEVSATYAKLMILNVETHVYETIMVLDKRYRIVQRKCVD